MRLVLRSFCLALIIATAIQGFTLGVLAPMLPRQVCRPRIELAKHLSLPSASNFSLNNADGAIVVNSSDRPGIDVLANVRAYASENDREIATKHLESLFGVTSDSALVTIQTEPHLRPDEVYLEVDYVVTVPAGTNVSIEGTNGNVSVSRGCGRTRIAGNNRDVKLEEPGGPVDVDITNGRIQVYDAQHYTNLKTVNGKIYAHVRSGELAAATTNGNIVVTLLASSVKSCDLNSMNGGITLVMPEKCSARVEAVTGRGVVKSDFEVKPLLGHQRQRQLRGIIGAGETRLSMNSLNGNIWLAKE